MPETFSNTHSDIRAGQIRRLIPDPDEFSFFDESRVVVILESHQHLDGTATVALMNNLLEIATDRDFVLPSDQTACEFDLALWIDFTSRVKITQLIGTPAYGDLDTSTLKHIDNLASVAPDMGLTAIIGVHPWQLGEYLPIVGDNVWVYRSNEMDVLNTLGIPVNDEMTMARFFDQQKVNFSSSSVFSLDVKTMRDAQIITELNIDYSRCVMV
jgi:hypothetical protein